MSSSTKKPEVARAPRVEAAFRVRYRTMDDLVVAYSKNLSRGGLFLRTRKYLPVDAQVRLVLALPDGGGDVELVGRVCYVKQERGADGKPQTPGMGVQFIDPENGVLERIERFIAELAEPPSEPALSDRTPINVLIVDDDSAYCEAAADPFRQRGDNVSIANDGLDALAQCLGQPPHVILSDVQMPKMDGWTFLRMVRARPQLEGVPFLFLTTLASETDRLRGYRLGVDDYIAKPYKPAEIVTRADEAILRARRRAQLAEGAKPLEGDLGQVGLPSVLSFLEMERKTGVLTVVADPGKAVTSVQIALKEGAPLAVRQSPASERPQREQLFAVLGWPTGRFEFLPKEEVADADQLKASVTNLLMEHATRIDEQSR